MTSRDPIWQLTRRKAHSSIAASLLKRHGLDNLEHVVEGGVPNLERHGIELVKR